MAVLFLGAQFIALNSKNAPNADNVDNNAPPNEITQGPGTMQEVYLKALGTGVYDKQKITVKRGIPVRLHFSAEQNSGCGKFFMIPKYGVQLVSRNGEEQTAVFTPNEAGVFEYSCSMRMFVGKLEVVA
ncbi:MAG: cupredoxin domain-containing protein [archaeon]|nr:cupredoxin domain-containing protein [archaeon]